MTEYEGNRVLANVSIYADTRTEIHREAERLKRLNPNERKPSSAKVVEIAWAAYLSSKGVAPAEQTKVEPRTGPVPIDAPHREEIKSPLGEPNESTSDARLGGADISQGVPNAIGETGRAVRRAERSVKRPPKRPGGGKAGAGGTK